MNGWMNGWMDEWMNYEWMNEWMNEACVADFNFRCASVSNRLLLSECISIRQFFFTYICNYFQNELQRGYYVTVKTSHSGDCHLDGERLGPSVLLELAVKEEWGAPYQKFKTGGIPFHATSCYSPAYHSWEDIKSYKFFPACTPVNILPKIIQIVFLRIFKLYFKPVLH